MGHHFVPQRYLKGFQDRTAPGNIWMYDKAGRTANRLPIKQVAQAPGFYKEEVETALNVEVEIPGNDVIDKIRRGQKLTDDDRVHLTYYTATMIRRVPRAREAAEKLIPQALTEVTQTYRAACWHAFRDGKIDQERLEKWLAEIDKAEAKLQVNPPEEVIRVIEDPWPFESMLLAINGMYWRFLRCDGPSYFLTSDNPVHFLALRVF
jgi:Protein of unknown function (DUF4238)